MIDTNAPYFLKFGEYDAGSGRYLHHTGIERHVGGGNHYLGIHGMMYGGGPSICVVMFIDETELALDSGRFTNFSKWEFRNKVTLPSTHKSFIQRSAMMNEIVTSISSDFGEWSLRFKRYDENFKVSSDATFSFKRVSDAVKFKLMYGDIVLS